MIFVKLKFFIPSFTLLWLSISLSSQPRDSVICYGGDSFSQSEKVLRGQISGVRVSDGDGDPGSSPVVSIRGLNSVFSDSAPLWIVDGIEISDAATNPLNLLSRFGIEKITVLKNISETALYGRKGANGVIIVDTKKEGNSMAWKSLLGVSSALRTAFSHAHSFSLARSASGSLYNASLWLDSPQYGVPRSGSLRGGYSFRYENNSSKYLSFGIVSSSAIGKSSSTLGPSAYGEPSTMMLARDAALFPADSYEGWVNDFDNNSTNLRSDNRLWLDIKFLPVLALHIAAGENFLKQEDRIWYGTATSVGADVGGLAGNVYSSLLAYNADVSLVYESYFAHSHHLRACLSIGAGGEKNSFNTMDGSGFFTEALRAGGLSLKEGKTPLRSFRYSVFSWDAALNLSYSFRNVLTADAVIRADRTPRYDRGMIFYPSANLGLDIRSLAFPKSHSVSNLVLRAGYGMAGREQFVPYEMIRDHITSSYPEAVLGGETFYEGFDRVISDEFNVGLTTGFLDGRISLDVGYYDKYARDVFSVFCFGVVGNKYWVGAPRSSVFEAVAGVRNRGVEGTLSLVPLRRQDSFIRLDLRGAYNFNRIDSCSQTSGSAFNGSFAGFPVACLLGYARPESPVRSLLGATVPGFLGSVSLNGRWKGLSADILFDGSAGFHVANLNAMLKAGSEVLTPQFVERGDFIRLSRVSIGYDIPLRKGLKTVSVRLTGENLLVVSSYSGWNPDVSCCYAGAMCSGIDYGSFPVCRSVTAGVRLDF